MDMVRKHCVEGTGNYDTAKACVDRTHQMIRMFKEATYNFVPPKDNIDKVPLGASSASMYPGYSPADHIYGEAAQEYGERAAELKRKGVDLQLDPNGPQYVVGQNKKPRLLSQEPETLAGSVSSTSAPSMRSQGQGGEPMEGVELSTGEPQYFVIDSKPSVVADLGEMQKQKNKANDKAKRRVSFKEEQEGEAASNNSFEPRKHKKAKMITSETPAAVIPEPAVQEEDISAEVEARLKAKEEKRKRKEEKKRKRYSGDSSEIAQGETPTIPAGAPDGTSSTSIEKPKKKMRKLDQSEQTDTAELSIKADAEKESKKDKKKKKQKATINGEDCAGLAETENVKPRKKKKDTTTSG
ncbi:hypothetical protein EPUS_00511 [Endocarpon pusillum Z07020]|uniref:Uncharacterized protein n=1 Tax=Endocarpon pusillum (strain Z07020 / HMAS-L-300199) TaxID=1263415 RepID=U1G2L1_ENDPU|nr:uncharacterized protein EPUS_00511 [Endocarpon pusillum Z07020]ERF71522.1 hypothetical protein EPUS_00511 [Endocarpon pusillum Z07020]